VALKVSTTATDSDWVVKVIDVYPPTFPDPVPLARESKSAKETDDDDRRSYSPMGGYQQLVRGEPFRGRFRNSFSRPEPFVPGEPTRVAFRMPDVNHTFRRGHRIMVQVQSSWFPLVDRNPQNFVKISTAVAADYRKATQRVHRGGRDGSSLTILSPGEPANPR
jgi:predicted acyl esterase